MLPALPFTILMPALSLLLVFRTNTGYSRWNEAHPKPKPTPKPSSNPNPNPNHRLLALERRAHAVGLQPHATRAATHPAYPPQVIYT